MLKIPESRRIKNRIDPTKLVVRIGVIGGAFTDEQSPKELTLKIEATLRFLQKIAKDIPGRYPDTYQTETEPETRLVSTLEEGRTFLTAQIAKRAGFSLQVALPHGIQHLDPERQNFLPQISSDSAILEFDTPPNDESKTEASRIVLRQSDILLAICEESPKTSDLRPLIEDALLLDIPIIWIASNKDHQTCLWSSKGTSGIDFEQKAPDWFINIYKFERGSSQEIHRYRGEGQPRFNFGLLFKLFCKLWVLDWPKPPLRVKDFQTAGQEDFDKYWSSLHKTDPSLKDRLKNHFLPEFARADGFADYYANLYRSSFVVAYLMGAAAILCAFLGSQENAGPFPLGVEFFLILVVIALTITGRQGRWHQRWIDYRVLAEELRQMQFLILFGRVTSSFRVPPHLEKSDPRHKWLNWQFRACVREKGLIGAKLDTEHLEAYRKVILAWVGSQKTYHSKTHSRFHRLHKRLHYTAQSFFLITLFACVFHLLPQIYHPFEEWLKENANLKHYDFFWSLLAIVLPAFGGALGAIAHIGEFERIESRSETLEEKVDNFLEQLAKLEGKASVLELGRIAQNFSEMALDELVDWRFAFIDKDLSLPS